MTRAALSAALAAAIFTGTAAARAGDASFILQNPTGSGCSSGAFGFDANTVAADAGTYGVRTLVDVGGTRYMDELAEATLSVGAGTVEWSLFDVNEGGTATGTWPMPTGQTMLVTTLLSDPEGTPVWENRVAFADCLATGPSSHTTGPVRQLAQNPGFEKAKGKKASGWKGGKRVCAPGPVLRSRSGECAIELKKGKARQSYATEPIADVGDQLRLAVHVKGTDVGAGSLVSLTLEFDGIGPTVSSAQISEGTYDYQRIEVAPVDVVTVPSAVTIAIQKSGGGTIEIDDVELLSVANAGPQI
jgi:hypothetical protein